MKLHNKAFPYPVLRPDTEDYLDSAFQAIIEPRVIERDTVQSVSVEYSFMLSNKSIHEAINSGTASFALEINCKDTLYRNVYMLDTQGEIEFPNNELYGRVEFTPFIIATEIIDNFHPEDINPEFGDTNFLLNPGDVIAYHQLEVAYIEFAKLKFESLIRVQTSPELAPYEYSIALESELVTILMGEKFRLVWDEASYDADKRPYLAMSVYKDCVLAALDFISKSDETDEYRWVRALKSKLSTLNISIHSDPELDEINKVAQELVSGLGIRRIVENV
jgi:hypothetical protein